MGKVSSADVRFCFNVFLVILTFEKDYDSVSILIEPRACQSLHVLCFSKLIIYLM